MNAIKICTTAAFMPIVLTPRGLFRVLALMVFLGLALLVRMLMNALLIYTPAMHTLFATTLMDLILAYARRDTRVMGRTVLKSVFANWVCTTATAAPLAQT